MSQFTDEELKQKVQDGYMVEGPEDMTEGYRKALESLNVVPPLPQRLIHPHEVLAVEDTPRGLRAAWSAGLATLGIAHTFPREDLSMADVVADGLSAVYSFYDPTRSKLALGTYKGSPTTRLLVVRDDFDRLPAS